MLRVDTDQTAPSVWSGSALFVYAILLEMYTRFRDIYCKYCK